MDPRKSSADLTAKLKGTPSAYRAEFLLILNHVRDCLQRGHSVVAIFEDVRASGDITCSYETFRRYVKRFISNEERRRRDVPSTLEVELGPDRSPPSDSPRPVPASGYRGVEIHPSALDGPPRLFKGPRGSR